VMPVTPTLSSASLHLVELERFYDRFDLLHCSPSAGSKQRSASTNRFLGLWARGSLTPGVHSGSSCPGIRQTSETGGRNETP
jgi:hypothetical protein